jgi:molybdenum cofactor cytidylyltransferase
MICAVVLAAGRSERMGSQKLLLPLSDKPVIAHVVGALSRSQAEQVIVVIGRDGERLRAAVADHTVQFAENPNPASDMLGSVRCGLRALPAKCEAAFVVLGDQPGIKHSLVDELIHCWQRNRGKIILPFCDGHRGHPVLISSQLFEPLNHSSSDSLRGFLESHVSETYNLRVSTTLEDMDTPADYERLRKLFSHRYADTVSPP